MAGVGAWLLPPFGRRITTDGWGGGLATTTSWKEDHH